MVRLNKNRMDFLEKFRKLIREYSEGSKNVEELFAELIDFVHSLNKEEQRAVERV